MGHPNLSSLLPNFLTNLDLGITSKCTSRCSSCRSYSSIGKTDFVWALDDIANKLSALKASVGASIRSFTISGGEPLTHPDIVGIVEFISRTYKESRVSIITNGLLLPKQGEAFFSVCREKNIPIIVSGYPWNKSLPIKELQKEFGVHIRFRTFEAASSWMHLPLIEPPPEKLRPTTAYVCHVECPHMNHRGIFTCVTKANFFLLKSAYPGVSHIPDPQGLGIEDVHTIEDILGFLSTPDPWCNRCSAIFLHSLKLLGLPHPPFAPYGAFSGSIRDWYQPDYVKDFLFNSTRQAPLGTYTTRQRLNPQVLAALQTARGG